MSRQRQQVRRALREHAAEEAAAAFGRRLRLALADRVVHAPAGDPAAEAWLTARRPAPAWTDGDTSYDPASDW